MSLSEALCLIYDQGSMDSELKRARVKKKIRKDAVKAGWEESLLKTLDVEWQWRLCCARLYLGYLDWKGWQYRRPREGLIPFKYPYWDGKSRVKKLLIMGEQGLGDEILFASCLNEIDFADEITVDCEPRLQRVLSENFPHIEFVGRKDLTDDWSHGEFDAQFLWGDLFPLYRRKRPFPSEPWIKVQPKYSYRTGISWKGRQGGFDPANIKADVSLQYDEHGAFPEPPIDLKEDIYGVFEVLAGLDKLISAPTSVVHFAGAMGISVDVILPKVGLNHGGFEPQTNNALNWRFSEKFNKGDRMIFHPSVKIHASLGSYLKTLK